MNIYCPYLDRVPIQTPNNDFMAEFGRAINDRAMMGKMMYTSGSTTVFRGACLFEGNDDITNIEYDHDNQFEVSAAHAAIPKGISPP